MPDSESTSRDELLARIERLERIIGDQQARIAKLEQRWPGEQHLARLREAFEQFTVPSTIRQAIHPADESDSKPESEGGAARFEKFTDEARAALTHAQEAARSFSHAYISNHAQVCATTGDFHSSEAKDPSLVEGMPP